MSDDQKRERFGRYLILDHLVDGGMAKICRARFLGEQADKVVAIKMVQPQYSKDESFKTMFMDEIKVTFGLLHPNIVQTYDYGLHDGHLFVAMEYCDGRNLKEYLDKLRQKKFVFPVPVCVYIVTQACQGLHYSHTYVDKLSGREAHIIHRDISPHNIMLTYDGAVKVIDFGIAKTKGNSEATQAGTIKGKLSYLAPEYLEGADLDHRYDQFAVGITLWEMLCSRKLFKAPNDLAVLKKIQECKIEPPSKINPNVPKELDQIVMKALSRDRTKRFANMDELNRALIKFLYAHYPDFNASDLAYFAKDLFKEEIKKDREKLFEYGKIEIRPYLEDLKRELEGGVSSSSSDDDGQKRKQENLLDFGFEVADQKTSKRLGGRSEPKKSATKVDIVAEMENVIKGDLAVQAPRAKAVAPGVSPRMASRASFPSEAGKTSTSRSTTRARSEDDTMSTFIGRGGGKSPLSKIVMAVGVAAFAIFLGKDYILPTNADIKRNPNSVASEKEEESSYKGIDESFGSKSNIGRLRLENFAKHEQRVYANGVPVDVDFLGMLKLASEKDFSIRVEAHRRRPFVTHVRLKKGETATLAIPPMPSESFGYLVNSKGCVRGKLLFSLYGEEREVSLPITSPLGILFPINGDGRTPAQEDGSAEFEVYVQRHNENIQRKIRLKFDKEDQKIDLCDYKI
jgi:serine/threonine-protein kinase